MQPLIDPIGLVLINRAAIEYETMIVFFPPFCRTFFFSPLHGISTNAITIRGTIYTHAFQPTINQLLTN